MRKGFDQKFWAFVLHRFLFILLGPLGKGPQYHEIGRSIATLMTDEVKKGIHSNITNELKLYIKWQ